MNTDLIIIGSGPGGYHTAEYAAKNGLSVTVIEEKHAGGTCLNCGCIPTKTFCHEAEVIETVSEYTGSRPEIDFSKIAYRKRQVVEQLRNGVETLMTTPGITFIKGKATIKDAHTVIVNNDELTAENIIIATGSHSKKPPIEGIDSEGVVTSTELLDIDRIPKRLCIIGAGVIGMEFASAFKSFGSEVTVIEFLKECLPALDGDIAKRLRKSLEKRGIEFCMQSAVKSISKEDGCLTVVFEKKNKHQQVKADIVLVATGREANTDGIGLDDAGVEYNRKGIIVDDNMKTNVDSIYAIGDVNGRMMLAHAATAQGMRCINHILKCKDKIRLDIMPSAVFTSPEAAGVGLTENQCEEQGIEYAAKKAFYRANGKAVAMNVAEGMVKLLTDNNGTIIGCHAYGAHASDIIQEATAIMNYNGTISDLHDIIHTHPTLGEILQDCSL
ncbi:MAG: dihydrolipoyl dehydrogenase [Prevotellaceae bacterium]|nr:dihydrolipoyl dehydrogenase [Prevotellaceae bacterium]